MTEQYTCDGSEIYDKEGEYLFQGFMELDGVLIVEKLNELAEENEQLKKDIQEKEEVIEFYQRFCGKRWCKMTENNNFNNIENDSTISGNKKKEVDLNKKTIEFEMPYDGKIPRAMNVIMEEWQREIKKILDEANIDEVTIRYGDVE